jgi:ribosomal protein L29
MKKKIRQDIRSASMADLNKKIREFQKQINDERMKRVSTPVKNTRLLKGIRHKLAMALTVKREKELAESR